MADPHQTTARHSEVVLMGGRGVGMTVPRNVYDFAAVLWRPKAESDKMLGLFDSRRKARRAVLEAANAR